MVHKATLKNPVLIAALYVGTASHFQARNTMYLNIYKLIKNNALPPPHLSNSVASLLFLIFPYSLSSKTIRFPFLLIWIVLKEIELSTLSLYFSIGLFSFQFARQTCYP